MKSHFMILAAPFWLIGGFLVAPSPGGPQADDPPVEVTASEAEFWEFADVKALDPWGDSGDDASDLIAVYEKEAGGLIHFRIDVMDARSDSKPNLYLAIDYAAGGTSALPGGISGSAGIEWDLMLSLSAAGKARIFDPAGKSKPELLESSSFDMTLDYGELAIHREALAGWDGSPFMIHTLAADAAGALTDSSSPAATDAATGRGKLALVFGNIFNAGGPASISWYDGFAFPAADHPGERGGYKYLLDAAEKFDLPLNLIDLRVETLPGLDLLGVLDRLRELSDRGLVDPITTSTYGYYMPWQPADADERMLRLAGEQREAFGLPHPDVYYPYEGWLTVEDLKEIREAGYPAIYATDRYGYWFGWLKDADWGISGAVENWHKAQRKIHMVNGVKIFFGLQGYPPDPRLGNVDFDPGWYLQNWDSFAGTDGGLHHGWRRMLLDLAIDPDQEQYISMGTDLWLTSWYFQSDAERNMRWLAAHPWIDVTTYSDLLERGWTPVDHGDLGLGPEEPLDQAVDNQTRSSGDYFWQYYYGGVSDGRSALIPAGEKIESYFDYVPYLNGGPIPSGMKMGDDKTPGTIIHETFRHLRSSPGNALTDLAWFAYYLNITEQTFHASREYASGESALDDPGGPFLHPGAKAQANHVRQVNKLVAAAHWAEQTARGEVPEEMQILAQDLDLDGEDEFVLQNDRVFAIFENDGGRLEYAFSHSPSGGVFQWAGPFYQFQISGYNNYLDGEIPPADSPWTDGVFEDRVTASGESYRSRVYAAVWNSTGLTFVSPDGKVRKTFTLDAETVRAHYTLGGPGDLFIGWALTPGATRLHARGWWFGIEPVLTAEAAGWQIPGGSALLDYSGVQFGGGASFLDDSYRAGMREPDPPADYTADHWQAFPFVQAGVVGQGEFDLHLSLLEKPAGLPGATPRRDSISTIPPDEERKPGGPFAPALCAVIILPAAVILLFALWLWRRTGRPRNR